MSGPDNVKPTSQPNFTVSLMWLPVRVGDVNKLLVDLVCRSGHENTETIPKIYFDFKVVFKDELFI